MLPVHLAENIREQILYYLQSTFVFQDGEAKKAFARFLLDEETGLFKGPWVELKRPFRLAEPLRSPPFNFELPFQPFRHQAAAWQRLSSLHYDPQSTIITTGTGSGKTECFLYPILDHCLRMRKRGERGIKAIVLYPMNALAADQEKRFARTIWQNGGLRGAGMRVGNYTGRYSAGESGGGGTKAMGEDHGISDHETQMREPPDILLTNYKMLDYLLMRPRDQRLWRENRPGTLQYLVLDELHTYDGAQGADVACLIRRLKERLGVVRGRLCFIGTSATLDEREATRDSQLRAGAAAHDIREASGDRLARFASALFEEEISVEAVIGEDRLTVEEMVASDPLGISVPGADESRPRPGEEATAYAARQAVLWGGPARGDLSLEAWQVELGRWLRRTTIFRALLEICGEAEEQREGPPTWEMIVERLSLAEAGIGAVGSAGERGQICASLFALLAVAREQRDGRSSPLMPTQAQLWIRELRRLGRRVSETPAFAWLDEAGGGGDALPVLPAFHCGECGESGWIALRSPLDETRIAARGVIGYTLEADPTRIYRAWFGPNGQRSGNIVVIVPGRGTGATRKSPGQKSLAFNDLWLCVNRLVIRQGDGPCPLTDDPRRFRVRVDQTTRIDEESGRPIGEQVCPSCGSREGLMFIGSQAATLSSVAIDELFGSTLNSDPKLLAFTDSVQDASHRAGFFSARTYHFTLRTALQRVIDEAASAGEDGLPLPDVGRRLLESLSAERSDRWNTSPALREAVALLLPPDLQEYPDFMAWRDAPADDPPPAGLLGEVERRLAWEVTSEFGLMQSRGRTLETTGSACLTWDEAIIDRTIEALRERLPSIDPTLTSLPPRLLRRWLYGVLHRARLRGALDHPFLDGYARQGFWGKFPFNRVLPGRETYPPAGRYRPSLIVTQPQRNQDHVLAETRGGQSPWQIVWARRALELPMAAETSLLDLLRRLLEIGAETGLFRRLHRDGACDYYAIAASAARLRGERVKLACDQTENSVVRHPSEAEYWLDGPSTEYRADRGTWREAEFDLRQRYYQDRYRKGALRRVVAREHTGLLDTAEREELERNFSRRRHNDDPNVLACTSTLEMGIDIGDLSSTMLCAIPPNTAGYLQRIGRAGRATGTSLIVSLINQRPHDLFFYGRPVEMLRGKVDPPGCWLDASAVLARQYLAFAIDSATAAGAIADLPRTARQMIDDLDSPTGHLPCLLNWIETHQDELRDRFLDRFREDIRQDTRERLLRETRAELLRNRIQQAAAEVGNALRDLENSRRRLRDQLNQLEADEVDARLEITRELRILQNRALSLGNTPSLEILTDRGLLPNYAFPEQGIPFYGTTYNRHRLESNGADDHRYIDIKRPAAAGLRELAPGNHFYTHSRRFDIQQIAVGNSQNPLDEVWAICGACGHIRRESELSPGLTACPQCGHDEESSSQADRGQHRRLLEFSRSTALSHMEHYESLSGDHREERDRQRYQMVFSFDLTREAPHGAVGEESLPFGIEYRAAVTMRELNVGYHGDSGQIPFGVNQLAPERGFQVCADCGIIAPPDAPGTKVVHRRSCSARRRIEKQQQEGRAGGDYRWTSLYLYRELESEAIRLLLPIADSADLETLSAAIVLGLRLRLEGDPDHLLVLPHAMPDPATRMPRYCLVLMDAVPGGTGYLKTLYQEADSDGREGEGILDILRRAKTALESCVCRQVRALPDHPENAGTADTDGCYRCLRTYRRQHTASQISRERAILLLNQLISAGERRLPRLALDNIRAKSLLESHLEKRFVDTLRDFVETGHGSWEQAVIRGRAGYRFTLPDDNGASRHTDRLWELEPQPTLHLAHDVAIQCRPDFILRCDDDRVPPLAIFTDGFEFHCHPHNRLADDLRKRRAILTSNRFRVWNITWDDLDPASPVQPMVATGHLTRQISDFVGRTQPKPDPIAALGNGMDQLKAFLISPLTERWRTLAGMLAWLPLRQKAGVETVETARLRAALDDWQSGAPLSRPEAGRGAEWVCFDATSPDGDIITCQLSANSLANRVHDPLILARLGDSDEERTRGDYLLRWRRFLAAINLFQFSDRFSFHAASEVATGSAPEIVLEPAAVIPPEWRQLERAVTSTLLPLIRELASRGTPLPRAEHFLDGGDGVDDGAFAELAWPEMSPPVAILAGEQETLAELWRRHGWDVTTLTDIRRDGLQTLADRLNSA